MANKFRLHYLDWLRGLAVLFMIQVHVFDSFLREDLRSTRAYAASQFFGGLAAPLFLFMAGVSLALVFDRLRSKGAHTRELIEKSARRGAWILLLAYAFRIEQVVVWYPYAPWTDVLKVDILNCIGVSYIAAGICGAFVADRRKNGALLFLIASVIALGTPLAATLHTGLPAMVVAYINGNGHLYFSIFPWAAYTFAGAATGYLLHEARSQSREHGFVFTCAMCGALLAAAGYFVNRHPGLMLGLADYSRFSPHYLLSKLGYVLMLVYAAYLWSKRRNAERWSPLLIFGQTSLLIYWLHIEFVYGRLRWFKNTLGVGSTAGQLLWLVPLMLAIAILKVRPRPKVTMP